LYLAAARDRRTPCLPAVIAEVARDLERRLGLRLAPKVRSAIVEDVLAFCRRIGGIEDRIAATLGGARRRKYMISLAGNFAPAW
jgi:hypothetical protein